MVDILQLTLIFVLRINFILTPKKGGGGIKPTYLKKCHTSNRIVVAKWVFLSSSDYVLYSSEVPKATDN